MARTLAKTAPNDSAVSAVVVVGTGEIPEGYTYSVVTERRIVETGKAGPTSHMETSGYAEGADLYLRVDPEVEFPEGARVLTLGEDLRQARTAGFCRRDGEVNVGPAHQAFAAANLAWSLFGATVITIVGLSSEEQAQLKPWFDELPSHPVEPAKVTVTFS